MSRGIFLVPLLLASSLAHSVINYERDQVEEDYGGQDSPLHIQTPLSSSQSVLNVLGRFPPWIKNEFSSIDVSVPTELSEGFARVIGTNEGVQVEATSPVAALNAIHSYLREFCSTMITWEGDNVKKIGACKRPLKFERSFKSPKIIHFGNPCTFSYSFAFWGWSEWERFIDWAALSGINTMLMPVGQEKIWTDLWIQLGVSKKGLDEFFSGPAYSAWSRMGNLQGLGGPLSQKYLESQQALAQRIIKRLLQLGIVPILPTFSGFVPKEFEREHPDLRFLHNACWNGLNETYTCTSTLHPDQDEFRGIGKLFIEMQKSVYGDVTNLYSADPFNESPPKHLTEKDLTAMSSSIFNACKMGNKKCVWVLQAWTFAYDGWKKGDVKAFLNEVPKGKLVVLDLQAEKRPLFKEFDDFSGHYFVWCLLQNFGGNAQMRGNLGKMHEDYRSALESSSGMIGAGITMEGINQNYVVYQYLLDLCQTTEIELNPHEWILGYAAARYGTVSTVQRRAWLLLLSTYYTQTGYKSPVLPDDDEPDVPNEKEERREIFLYFRPQLAQRIRYWFTEAAIKKIVDSFTILNRTLGSNKLFKLDYADVRREQIQLELGKKIQSIYNAYGTSQKGLLKKRCSDMDDLFEQLDRNEQHQLSDWIIAARNAATSESEADAFEIQAKNQITLWGPSGEIIDYARKEWGGLIRKYYGKRWTAFCDYLQTGARWSKKKFDEIVFKDVELPFGHL